MQGTGSKREGLPDCVSGIVVIADIVDFSLMTADSQLLAVMHLWSYVEGHALIAAHTTEAHPHDVIWNSTGDGILVAFACGTVVVSPDVVLRFVEGLVEHCREGTPSTEIRVGVHRGAFRRPHALGRYQVVGNAPNECARIAAIGDAGHVVCSEAFVQHWAKESEGVWQRFVPHDPERPVEVFVKHDVAAQIRLYRVGGKAAKSPRRIARMDAVEQRLRNRLQEVEAEVVSGIRWCWPEAPGSAELSPRVSVLGPRREAKKRYLAPTSYRFHASGHALAKGTSRYWLQGKGQGPPGRAFQSKEPQVLRGLPSYEANPDEYVAQLSGTWGLPRAMIVNGWQRHARSFVCIPVGLATNTVDAVLCVDLLDPLEPVSDEDLNALALKIQRAHADVLAELWALRIVS